MRDLALLVIDVQMGFANRDATGDERSCPEAEENIQTLLVKARAAKTPVFHIHHHSHEEGSYFLIGTKGTDVQPFAAPKANEPVIVKHVNSGFIGTDLDEQLKARGISRVVICGATANHCVETTTRMAGNLGYDTYYVSDATWAYAAKGPDGASHTASDVHAMSLCNLHGEFAEVLNTKRALALLG